MCRCAVCVLSGAARHPSRHIPASTSCPPSASPCNSCLTVRQRAPPTVPGKPGKRFTGGGCRHWQTLPQLSHHRQRLGRPASGPTTCSVGMKQTYVQSLTMLSIFRLVLLGETQCLVYRLFKSFYVPSSKKNRPSFFFFFAICLFFLKLQEEQLSSKRLFNSAIC